MDQYRPCYNAFEHPPMKRMITKEEFEEAIEIAREKGLNKLDGFID